jgi:glucose-6-phosphate isomerase
MQLKFYNTPEPLAFEAALSETEKPPFLSYHPDWHLIEEVKQKYAGLKNLLIIAHGGSLNSFYGFYNAYRDTISLRVEFLNTTDPDYIFKLQSELKAEDTLVVAISKSGQTVTQLEALMHFANYPNLIVISEAGSTLSEVGARLKATLVTHPQVGGRYTAFTEAALLPAAICGLDVKALHKSAQALFKSFNQDNLAWRAASVVWQLEQQSSYVGVFMPFYSHYYYAFSKLIIQLCHESFSKDGKGQTYFAHEAPESQHHTNQRLLGGRQNLIGFFIGQETYEHDKETIVPTQLHSVKIKNQDMFLFNRIPLSKTLEFEMQGTIEDARTKNIPVVHLSINGRSFEEVGNFVAFWQLYAIYSALLRGVNAFDQPSVEASKLISFNKRLQFKGL